MKIYLAARYSRRLELLRYAHDLEAKGHEIVSTWIDGHHETAPGIDGAAPDELRGVWAAEDLRDCARAECVISFTEAPRETPPNRPGPEHVERWLPVRDSRLDYEVSSFGRVCNAEGEVLTGKRNRGYLLVRPSGKTGSLRPVHQLVAEVFIGPCPDGHELDHLDGYKDNNWVGNLEYVTHTENVRRAAARMRDGPHAGERNGRAKLTYDDVATIRDRLYQDDSKAAIARDFGVSDVLIGKIASGKLWPNDDDGSGRGGRHSEFGIGLANPRRPQLVLIGPREHVFHCLPYVAQFDAWAPFLAAFPTVARRPVARESW